MKTDEPMWLKHYKRIPGSRPESLTPESSRALENLWYAANQDEDQFRDLVEVIRDVALGLAKGDIESVVANPLLPPTKEKWQPPQLPTIDGVPMPNPFIKGGSTADRKMLERKLALAEAEHRDNPRDILCAAEFHKWSELITHLRRSAGDPVSYGLERAEAEERRVRWNTALSDYKHDENAYATGKNIAEFEERTEPQLKPIFRALARPMALPLFGAHSEQNRTLLARLHHVGGKVWAAIEAGQKREMELRADEAKRADEEKAERIRVHLETQKDLQELSAGVTKLPDGRRVTMPLAALGGGR